MALSFVASDTGENNAGAVTTATCAGTLNVLAGDTLYAVVEYEAGDNTETLTVQKDSGSPANAFTFDASKRGTNGGTCILAMGHLAVASADAAAKFKLTISVARDFPRVLVRQFRGGMAVHGTAFAIASGSSTAPNSGNFTVPSGNSIVCGAYANDSGDDAASELINAVAADGTLDDSLGNAGSWYRIVSSGFTGAASATASGSITWACGGMTFVESASGPPAAPLINLPPSPPPTQRMT